MNSTHLALVCLLASACIDTNRADGPTTTPTETTPTDTNEADTSVTPDSVEPTTSEPDSGITLPDTLFDTSVLDDITVPDVVIGSCDLDQQCLPSNGAPALPCFSYTCKSHQCVVEMKENGSFCDDGRGQPTSECIDGWYGYPDSCDGGECVSGPSEPEEEQPLLGEWYGVISRVGNTTGSLRGRFSFSDSGTFVGSGLQGSQGWVSSLGEGTVCVAHSGLINFNGKDDNYVGYRNQNNDVFVFGDQDNGQLGIAVRPTHDVIVIEGTYIVAMMVSDGEAGRVLTRIGTVSFDDGCIAEEAAIGSGPADVSYLAAGDGHCLTGFSASGGTTMYHLDVVLLPHPDAAETDGKQEAWRGVVSRTGHLVLLTADQANEQPRFGTILLLKEPNGDLGESFGPELAEQWAMVSLQGGSAGVARTVGAPFVRIAELMPRAETSELKGVVYDPGEDPNEFRDGWYFVGEEARYAQMVRANPKTYYAGIGIHGSDFIAGVVVSAPNDAQPGLLGPWPSEGSLMLMTTLKRY